MQRGTVAGCCLMLVLTTSAVQGQAPSPSPQPGQVGSGLGTWATVLANVLVNREGGADGAYSALSNFEQETRSQLQSLVDTLMMPGASFPELPIIRDMAAFASANPFAPAEDTSGGRKGGSSFLDKPFTPAPITGASLSSVFFNYAPCLISQDVVGAAATAVGINIVPEVINVAVRGAWAAPIGLNVNPAVILVNAEGAQYWSRGLNVQPTLIAIVPTGFSDSPKGLEVAPYGIAVTGK
ncbi:hypothetical protein WJX81_001996 [Elliptochloris bilobata]|uniref:Uncharacterized protein n=1 Tax=Elliptochloris bilobata TaxID=381761 RepID=A0AAW1SJ66_9CHLO